MKLIATTAAAVSIALGFGAMTALPAAATTVDQAQCADARGSGSLNQIRLYCGEPGVPSTVVMPGAVFGSMLLDGTPRASSDAALDLRDMNCMQARNENSQANIAFFCS